MLIYMLYRFVRSVMPAALGGLENMAVTAGGVFIIFLGLGICINALTGHDHVGGALDKTHSAALSAMGWVIRSILSAAWSVILLIGRSVRALYLWVFRYMAARGHRPVVAAFLGAFASIIWLVII